MPARQARLLSLLLLTLGSGALAHGERVQSDLRGQILCVDATSVQVVFEDMVTRGQQSAQPRVERMLRKALIAALKDGKVRFESPRSCRASKAFTQLRVEVRYLNPEQYVGFGDPAYSYGVALKVAAHPEREKGAGKARFDAGVSDIHSEARTRTPFGMEMVKWGKELARDLALAWRQDNPARRN